VYRLGQGAFAGEEATTESTRTRAVLSQDERVLGWFEFADQPRADAKALIEKLTAMNLKTLMLTGDNAAVAHALAADLGIDQVMAELTPDQKIEAIRNLQSKGLRVAMVGDGINDSPALAAADVGIAMGSGSEIALKSAPVVLMRHDLDLIRQAEVLAVRTRRVIRQNLGWAFGYNVLCIPLAVSGLLTPAVAGLAMALSSVSVVANALRLKAKIPRPSDPRFDGPRQSDQTSDHQTPPIASRHPDAEIKQYQHIQRSEKIKLPRLSAQRPTADRRTGATAKAKSANMA